MATAFTSARISISVCVCVCGGVFVPFSGLPRPFMSSNPKVVHAMGHHDRIQDSDTYWVHNWQERPCVPVDLALVQTMH